MSRIPIPNYEDLCAEAKREYDNQIQLHGKITNMKKTLLHDVPSFRVLMDWYTLRDNLVPVIGDFGINIFSHAISTENNCLICSTFFRKLLKDSGRDPDNPVLSDTEKLLVEYGKACVIQPVKVSDELFAKMKERFSFQEIVMLTSFAGMMIATNLINNALEVELDGYLTSYTKR